jgi:hypothetical protein
MFRKPWPWNRNFKQIERSAEAEAWKFRELQPSIRSVNGNESIFQNASKLKNPERCKSRRKPASRKEEK